MPRSLEGVLAQRLGRRVCPHCRAHVPMAEDVAHRLRPDELARFGGRVWTGQGCDECNGSGTYGRIGFFELLQINAALRRAISENRSTTDLLTAIGPNFKTMRVDGLDKAVEGLTTIEEVLRATQDADEMSV